MPDFAPGQRWAYRTRPGEETSTLLLLGREVLGDLVVLHLRLEGLRLRTPDGGFLSEVGHTPVSEEAVRQSVTSLLEQNLPLPGGNEGEQEWRAAYGRGEAGVFTLPAAEVVQALEDVINAPLPADLFRRSNRG